MSKQNQYLFSTKLSTFFNCFCAKSKSVDLVRIKKSLIEIFQSRICAIGNFAYLRNFSELN